jgi:phage terminase large subunit-like protein
LHLSPSLPDPTQPPPPPSKAYTAELAKRILARRGLIHFTRRFYPAYLPGWVHQDMARRLEDFMKAIEQRQSPRLMLLVPPRHGKSELASIRFSAFALGHHPEWEVINCGYNLDLPMKFSRKVREIVRDPGFAPLFPTCLIDPESQSAEAWNTTAGGGFTAAGVGGGIVGKGAHVLIIDDPIKNQEEADSVLTRDGLWDWYWSTAYTRLAPGAGVLIIQTWWHDDDLAGRIQERMANPPSQASAADLTQTTAPVDQFVIVKYPAIAEQWEYRNKVTDLIERYPEPLDPSHPDLRLPQRARSVSVPNDLSKLPKPVDPGLGEWRDLSHFDLLRMPGEALHPERYSEPMMLSMKANQPPRIWSALFQQAPVPDEGMYFTKTSFRYEAVAPAAFRRNVFQAWDFAIGEKQQNDYTVGVTLIQDELDFLHLVELIRFRSSDSYRIVDEMVGAAVRWGSTPSAPLTIGMEDGMLWRALEPLFQKVCAERRFYPPYQALRPLTDKVARARSLQGRLQQGRVYFLADAAYLPDLHTELLRFPTGVHDDIVDALAWCVNLCIGRAPQVQPTIKPPPSWKDRLNQFIAPGYGTGHMSA